MFQLTDAEIKMIRDVFVEYIPIEDIERMITDAGIAGENILLVGTPKNVWFNVFKEAKKQRKVFHLINEFPKRYLNEVEVRPALELINKAIENGHDGQSEIIIVNDTFKKNFSDNPILNQLYDILSKHYIADKLLALSKEGNSLISIPFDDREEYYDLALSKYITLLEDEQKVHELIFELFFSNRSDQVYRLFKKFLEEREYLEHVTSTFNHLYIVKRYDDLLEALLKYKNTSHTISFPRLHALINIADNRRRQGNIEGYISQLNEIIQLYFPSEIIRDGIVITFNPNPNIINFKQEINRFIDIASRRRPEKVLICYGEENAGKSTLLSEFVRILKENNLEVLDFECERQTNFRKLVSMINQQISNYENELIDADSMREIKFAFPDEKSASCLLDTIAQVNNNPFFLIFSNINKAPSEFKVWFEEAFIQILSNQKSNVIVLTTCDEEIGFDKSNEFIIDMELKGFSKETYFDYIEKTHRLEFGRRVKDALSTQIERNNGLPGIIVPIIETLQIINNGN